jgi:4-aminobutyrate aminotransferase-like enzyme
MGGGIPISGVIGKKKIMDLPEVGNMSSTHSANPLACYAGLAVLDEIKKNRLVKKSNFLGKILFKNLNNIKKKMPASVKAIQGRGLIAAIIFDESIENINIKLKNVVEECLKEGLLVVYTGRESIKIGPPLTISSSALLEGIKILEKNILKFLK